MLSSHKMEALLLGMLQTVAHTYTEVLFFILFSTVTARFACQLRKSYWLRGQELFEFKKHYERSLHCALWTICSQGYQAS